MINIGGFTAAFSIFFLFFHPIVDILLRHAVQHQSVAEIHIVVCQKSVHFLSQFIVFLISDWFKPLV